MVLENKFFWTLLDTSRNRPLLWGDNIIRNRQEGFIVNEAGNIE